MAVEWRPKMSVGNELIDKDHQHLFRIIAEYEDTIQHKNVKRLNIVFQAFLKYTDEHFKREEQLLYKTTYPFANAHAQHHAKLIIQLRDFHNNLVENHKFDVNATSEFFRKWLLEHVLQEDLKFKKHLEALSGK